MRHRSAAVFCILAASVAPTAAAAPPKLTVERIHADPALSGDLLTGLAWHPDGRRLTFVRGSGTAVKLCALDVANGVETVLLEGAGVLVPGSDSKPLPLASGVWLRDGRRLLVSAEGDIFIVDVASGNVRALVRTPEREDFALPSPDGARIAFVRKNDLYTLDVATGRETRLTRSGSDTVLNGRLDWVYEEELASRSAAAFSWSPDSRKLAFVQLDQTRVPTFPIVDFVPVRNQVEWQRYPTAGEPNSVVRLGVVGIDHDGTAGPERLLSFEPDDVYLLPQLAWTPDSRQLAFQRLNRAQSELQLRLLPVPSSPTEALGPPRTVLVERSPNWVNTFGAPHFLRDGRRFLWLSERDGFAHVYVCDLAGGCRPVTQGAWMVDAAVSFSRPQPSLVFDEHSSFLYFTATEKDPRERHLYRIRLDGTGRSRLTQEDGTHRVLVSPDGRFYADTWSNLSTPPRLWVSSQDGTKRFLVDENLHPPILGFERGAVEPVEIAAKDGTRLYAALLKPSDFDPKRRYPVVVRVYGGPHAQTVTNSWSQASPFDHLLASQGFLVWWLDNRGSAGRGTAFEAAIKGDLGRAELADQLAGLDYLKSQPWVDADRIGITGWSYGGFMTLYAVTNAPAAFRAAVAGAPVTDWRFYDSIYTERYLGTPTSNPKGYETSSTLRKAASLTADLLLIHGTADDNVHLANTVAFVNALIAAGRPYRLQVHPRQTHGLRPKEDRVARDRAILAHFTRTLASGH